MRGECRYRVKANSGFFTVTNKAITFFFHVSNVYEPHVGAVANCGYNTNVLRTSTLKKENLM